MKLILTKLLPFLAAVLFISACSQSFEVDDPTCEMLDEPLAIDSDQPHFSWKIDSEEPMSQYAWEIEVASTQKLLRKGEANLWKSGKVISADQIMIPYAGSPLSSKQQCWWRVRVWKNENEKSAWCKPQHLGIGILEQESFAGEYIGAVPGDGRSALLRTSFHLDGNRYPAILYVNSYGYHEAYINGKKVCDAVLTPAVSELRAHSLIVAYDVKDYLRRGDNEIVLWTGSGWFKPDTFEAKYDGALVKAELDVLQNGEAQCVVKTDGTWTGCWSGYKDTGTWRPHKFGGEEIDASIVPVSLERKFLDKLEWTPVDTIDMSGLKVTPQSCELCTVQEELSPVSIEPYQDNAILVDFGRVMNGMLEINLPALPAGTAVKVSFTDNKDKDGNMEFTGFNTYISSGRRCGDKFIDRFNHHVFRYILIENLPTTLRLENIKAKRMRTDYEKTVKFKCSDKDMNDIFNMVSYTMENLAFDGYMVDCANIERLGYGGDGNASTLSLQSMFDVSPLYVNWLEAWNDCILDDGCLPHTAPAPYKAGGGPYWCSFIVQAPWRTYMSYGDARMIERCYNSMKLWLNYVDTYTIDGLLREWPNYKYRHWYLGDWAAPVNTPVDVKDPESILLVNNCSLCQSYLDLINIADMVGTAEEKANYQERYDALKERIHNKLWHPADSTYGSGSQIDMVFPMLVGVVPDELKPLVKAKLVERTATLYGGNLCTGLVGIPVMAEWATLEHESDYLYGMLKQEDYPGYLYMLRNGATGTWEHWQGRRSRMHNCFNGIGSWFIQALGGLIPTSAGYRTVTIDPQLPAGIKWIELEKETPYGEIEIECEREDGRLELEVEIPVGITATIAGKQYGCGKHELHL